MGELPRSPMGTGRRARAEASDGGAALRVERRRHARSGTRLVVRVVDAGGRRFVRRTRNVSLEGMFVELAACELGVCAGMALRVSFVIDGAPPRRRHSLAATVAHVDADGAGVGFQSLELDLLGRLFTVVHGTPAQRLAGAARLSVDLLA